MRKLFWAAVSVMVGGLLPACASLPEEHLYTRRVEGAFLAADNHLYLLSLGKTLRFDGAPFRRYRALVESPLKQAVACSRMYLREDMRIDADKLKVYGSYAMLLHADQVRPEQAEQFGLVLLQVSAKDAAKAASAGQGLSAKPLRQRYELAADPACDLPATGGRYYSALFESVGQWVQLPDYEKLLDKSRLPQPIQARAELVRPPRAPSGSGVVGTALGVAALPITLPVFVLSIPFLGSEHWK
ncbi:hypothetical protein [Comamonas sp. NoAH]|uniref:hypothetical protein n=1 Tax=Comamonas halotolerans TaxID=3041496 RepID=UPI0024E0E165|nr:hypothetical protein [Comamonas sp. NoAH]